MLDMKRVGRKISAYRRERNMTQMELADRMGVSFQAVSNWERGETMPDITRLNELAGIFGVSIDELLDNQLGSKIIEKLAKNDGDVKVSTLKEFAEIAPIIKPETSDALARNLEDIDYIDLNDLVPLAPYLSEEALVAMVRRIPIDELRKVTPLAPYLPEEFLSELIEKSITKNNSFKEAVGLMPFIDSDILNKFVREIRKSNSDVKILMPIVPFMEEEDIKEIAVEEIRKGNFKALTALAPFIESDELDQLIKDKVIR